MSVKEFLEKYFQVAFYASAIGLMVLIFDFGFKQSESLHDFINGYYFFTIGLGSLAILLGYISGNRKLQLKSVLFDLLSVGFFALLVYAFFSNQNQWPFYQIKHEPVWIRLALLINFIREASEVKINYKRTVLNPAQLFIASFLIIILIGTALLMLPKATTQGISFLDALFTSTSAVCVTGLSVIDTGKNFTELGLIILMVLIQVGGLGILTFASYFSYFFKGGTSYENQLVLSDMTSAKKMGEVFSILKYIILITFIIELFAAGLIYLSLNSQLFPNYYDRIFFAIFHSISAFCNAGFSTLSNSLYEPAFRYNYLLQLSVIFGFFMGGLGFPIVSNLLTYLKYKLTRLLHYKKQKKVHKPWVLNINSRITLITTLSLTAIGFIAFLALEYHHTLAEHKGLGKLVVALFGATTPRTAGFNSIDNAAMQFPTLMIVLLLMWIGASPLSTGGGIKTNTFAIATLNILSLAKGKTRIEIFRREIADISVRRAFATISLSLMVIGIGILFISIFDTDKDLMSVAFEAFSAYSTVGLSLGITASLSSASKLVLIALMFIGRVSMLSLMIAVFRKVKHKNYQYPTEEITIN
jgi:trk system potassium uptake protein